MNAEDRQELNSLLSQAIRFFPEFARKLLKIATKAGKLLPLTLNRAQQHIHDKLEEQLFEQGHVRALILKGRQQGASTLIEARLYWKVAFKFGQRRAFILTHLQEATDNLFAMVKRYHDNLHPLVRPMTSSSNAKELQFSRSGSGYKVSTAGSKSTGRSSTIHFFHGSEVAFWPNAELHAGGVLQAVPEGEETEIILESTANGVGGYFYEQWQKAEKGESEFIAIFVPWFWQDEYRKEVKPGWTPSEDELFYIENYDLDIEQAYWMHTKNIELGAKEAGIIGWHFLQEYPFCAADAFQVSGEDSICSPKDVARARKTKAIDPQGAHLLGVDPARFGKDRAAWIHRRGRKAWGLKTKAQTSVTELAALIAREIVEAEEAGDPFDAVFIDGTGIGGGVVDVLHDAGYRRLVIEVNAGNTATDEVKYANKKIEMWDTCAEWLEQRGVEIPDNDALHADLVTPRYSYNMKDQKVSETKTQMKTRGADSPDCAEALIQTFAFPIQKDAGKRGRGRRKNPGDWRAA